MQSNPQNITFAIIKPEAVKKNLIGKITTIIEKNQFEICGITMIQMTLEKAKLFYKMHEDRPFYNDLCTYMCSGKIVAMVLKKTNAVENFRKLIGTTNPKDAAKNTIRYQFGTSIEENAIHGSDSDDNANREKAFFFKKS